VWSDDDVATALETSHMTHTTATATATATAPVDGTVISSHATSQGLIVYYRRSDGSLEVVREPRPVMPKRVVLPAA